MKTLLTKRSILCGLITICAYVLALTSCHSNKGTSSLPLITERHECMLGTFTHLTGDVCPISISIDIPVEGPQALLDSLTAFLNETLYAYFDNGEGRHIPYKNAYSSNLKQLTKHYREAYAPFIMADSTDEHRFATDQLEVNVAVQTDTYVTFEVDHIFFGEGIEIAMEWVTFVKNNGHRLTEVISENNMLRFYREHPNLASTDIWENFLNQCYEIDSLSNIVCSVGLLGDTLAHQYIYAPGIFEDIKYPLDSIAPYLSKEAQKLIKIK